MRCTPGFHQASKPPDFSGSSGPPEAGQLAALTCIPGTGVALLGIAQPLLVPGVRKVNEQRQLDEDEDEGAHDTKVEPDWMGRVGERGELVRPWAKA